MIFWIYLALAGLAEALFGIGLYHSHGFTRLGPSVLAIAGGLVTSWLLALSMKGLPLGLSFAVWSILASVGTAIYGMVALGEARDPVRPTLLGLAIAAVAGLKLTSAH